MADPSHVDLSVLYVPIMPETSNLGEAMVKAGQDATESFGKGSEKIGDKIHESFSKSKDKLKDVFHRSGSDAAEAMADGVKQQSSKVEDALGDTGKKASGKFRDAMGDLGKEMVGAIGPDVKRQLGAKVEDAVGGAFKSAFGDSGIGKTIGDALGTAANSGVQTWVTDLQKKLGGVKDAANDTKKAFAELSSGNTQTGVAKLVDGFGKLGLEAKDLPDPIRHVVDETSDLKNTVSDVADIFKGMPGIIGRMGTALEGLSGPLGVLAATAFAIKEAYDWGTAHVDADMNRNTPFVPNMPTVPQGIPGAGALIPGAVPSTQGVPMPKLTDDQKMALQYMGIDPAHADPKEIYKALNIPLPAPPPAPLFPGVPATGPAGSWFGGGGGGRAVAPSSFMPTPVPGRDVGSDQGLTPTSKSVKQIVSELFPQIKDIGGWRPPDGYNEHSSGQALDVMIPNASSPQGKALGDQISQYVLAHAKELGVDYTIWQHGQHNPDGSFQMYPDRGSPTQNHMDHVHIHTVRGGGSGSPSDLLASGAGGGVPDSFGGGSSTSLGSGGGPTGTPNNPVFVALAGSAGGSGGGGSVGGGSLGGAGGGGPQMPNFLGGALQMGGLDGSVFHTFGGASNPMDFGAVKLGTGLLKTFAPMFGGRGSGPNNLAAADGRIHSPLAGITAASGHGPSGEGAMPHLVPNSGGGSGGGGSDLVGDAVNLAGAAFSDLFNPGPVIPFPNRDLGGGTGGLPWSAGGPQDPVGRGVALPGMAPPGAPTPSGESVTPNVTNNNVNVDNSVTQHGVQGTGVQPWQAVNNSRSTAAMAGAAFSGLP